MNNKIKPEEFDVDPLDIQWELRRSNDPEWIKGKSPVEFATTCPDCCKTFFQKILWDGSRSKHNCGGTV